LLHRRICNSMEIYHCADAISKRFPFVDRKHSLSFVGAVMKSLEDLAKPEAMEAFLKEKAPYRT